MKKTLPVILISLLFLIGLVSCAGISLKSETTEVAIDISASTIGYLVGQKNIDKIPQWNDWIDTILTIEYGASTLSYEMLLAKGFEIVCDSPFLEMQLNKLIKLLEFPEIQPPELPFLKEEYINLVKIIMGGFRDGLVAAQAEAKG